MGKVDKFVSASGAVSSEEAPRFDQIPLAALLEVAKRYELGAKVHGEYNWVRGAGDEKYETDRFNHTVYHLLKYWAKRLGFMLPLEDSAVEDLAAVAWGALTLLTYELMRSGSAETWVERLERFEREKGKSGATTSTAKGSSED